MKIGMKHLLATSALAVVIAPVASAQDNPFLRGRYTAVAERQQPEYDPEVIHAGSFDLISSLTATVETNDNVFYQPANEQDDIIFRIRPAVEARSNWTVHSLTAGLVVDHAEYKDFDSETTTDYNAYLRGRLDVVRNFRVNLSLDGGHDTEQRFEPASQNAPEPAQNDFLGADLSGTYRTDRLQFEVGVGTRENDYQSFFNYRDVTDTYVRARASYAISPDLAVFVQGRQTDSSYDSAANRDAKQTSIQAGLNFELAAPFSGEVSVGSVKNKKDSPTEPDTDGLSLNAFVQWFPTQLTTVSFSGSAGISDPGILQSTSAKYRRFSVRADHELFRNLLLYGQFGFGNSDYEAAAAFPGFVRSDDTREVRAGVVYKLNKHAHLDLGYRMNSRDTSGTTPQNIDVNVFSASIRVFP
jgi:hypothetical protein